MRAQNIGVEPDKLIKLLIREAKSGAFHPYFYPMPRHPKTIALTMEDVSFFFNNNLAEFYFITSKCHCIHCQKDYNSTIIKYRISLNRLYDLELKGKCLECGGDMSRYIETGGDLKTEVNAKVIWQTATALKGLKDQDKR